MKRRRREKKLTYRKEKVYRLFAFWQIFFFDFFSRVFQSSHCFSARIFSIVIFFGRTKEIPYNVERSNEWKIKRKQKQRATDAHRTHCSRQNKKVTLKITAETELFYLDLTQYSNNRSNATIQYSRRYVHCVSQKTNPVTWKQYSCNFYFTFIYFVNEKATAWRTQTIKCTK